jgi:hypothetical protein
VGAGVQRDRAPGDQRHAVVRKPALVLERECVLVELTAKQLLRERWASIRHAVLVGDDGDRASTTGRAVAASGRKSRRPASAREQLEGLVHRRSSTSSR